MKRYMKGPIGLMLVAAVAAAVIVGSAVAATRGGPGPGMGMGRGQGMGPWSPYASGEAAKALNLTPAQQKRINAIMEEHRKRALSVRQSNLSPERKSAQLNEIRQDARQKITQVLTPMQRKKAQAMMQARPAGRGMFGGPMQGGFAELNLTPAQQEKIRAIRQKGMEAVRDVRMNAKLSERAKADRIQAIRNRTHEEVMSVLTREQRRKLETIRPGLGTGRQGGGGLGQGGRGWRGGAGGGPRGW